LYVVLRCAGGVVHDVTGVTLTCDSDSG
jgi:hypothetical protein